MRRVRFFLEATAFRILLALARVIPRSMLLAAGSGIGYLGYLFDHRHRNIALENLETVFGPSAAHKTVVRRCWRHFGRIMLDALSFPRLSADSVGTEVTYQGLEHIRRAYGYGKGVILFSAHFGHWELVALMQGFLGMPLSLVARPLDNRELERMLAGLRSGSGNSIIHKRNAVREMLKVLRDGSGIAIVIDQDARDDGVFVPFMGRPASTTPTLALMALRTGATVVPVFSVPMPDGSYLVTYEPAVEIIDTGDRDADVLKITAACTSIIERWVRRHPELWLWMHRRWKTRP